MSASASPLALPSGVVRSISISAKTWRDRVNGNSYFAVRIIVEYTSFSTVTLHIPFQIGYGSAWEQAAAAAIAKKFELGHAPILRDIEQNNLDVVFFKLATPSKKREAIAWGVADAE
jgi:hypothetical protein